MKCYTIDRRLLRINGIGIPYHSFETFSVIHAKNENRAILLLLKKLLQLYRKDFINIIDYIIEIFVIDNRNNLPINEFELWYKKEKGKDLFRPVRSSEINIYINLIYEFLKVYEKKLSQWFTIRGMEERNDEFIT